MNFFFSFNTPGSLVKGQDLERREVCLPIRALSAGLDRGAKSPVFYMHLSSEGWWWAKLKNFLLIWIQEIILSPTVCHALYIHFILTFT